MTILRIDKRHREAFSKTAIEQGVYVLYYEYENDPIIEAHVDITDLTVMFFFTRMFQMEVNSNITRSVI